MEVGDYYDDFFGIMAAGPSLGLALFGNLRNVQAPALRERSKLRLARRSDFETTTSTSGICFGSFPLLWKERRRRRSHHPWRTLHFLQLWWRRSTVSRRSSLCVPIFGQKACSQDWLTFVLLVNAQCLTNFLRKLLFRQLSLSPAVTFMSEMVREKQDTLFSVEQL